MKQPAANTPTEQDNGWKEMLDAFFPNFVAFFFPPIHADIDWTRGYEFLDKELAKLGREHAGGKRLADKLVKVWLRDGSETWLLIHLEIQGRPEKLFNRRTYTYNYRIFDKHGGEVISLVIVTGRGGARVGRYESARWGFRLLCEFPVVRLTEYRGREAELAASRNPFALVVLTQLKLLEAKGDSQKKLAAKRELLRGLLRGGADKRYINGLLRFIDWVMVLPVELEQQLDYELAEEEKKMPFMTSWERRGFAKGLVQGQEEGKQELILRLLTRRLGKIEAGLHAQVAQLSVKKLEQLGEALLDFSAPQDLEKWLRRHTRTRQLAAAKNGQTH